ncbi:MAG: phosphotransferase [Erysipelotrichaceae bacterium]|nr:phosphotransferase [Erysipelotrichaceae bacterium]
MKFNSIKRIPLNKGWSSDRKFILKSSSETVLLRILDSTKFHRKIQEINYLQQLDLAPVQFSQGLSVELIKNEVHYKTSYLVGQDLEEVIDSLSYEQQIELGHQAGYALKAIHSQVKIDETLSWEMHYGSKMDRNIKAYKECGTRFIGDDLLIDKLNELRDLIKARPVSFQHGDYHIGNFLLCEDGNLGILDFDRWDIGDPWEEFNRIVWTREKSPLFTRSMIMSYFDDQIPDHFFDLLFLYIGVNCLASIPWATKYNDEEIKVMLKLIQRFDEDTLHFTQTKPLWFY